MNFPNIVSGEKIVFPKIETLEKINEFEEAFEQWIQGAFRDGGPKPREVYIFCKCMKPWFRILYDRDGADKAFLIKQYGTYLRNSFIDSSKSKFLERNSLQNNGSLFSRIKYHIQSSSVLWSQTGTEQIAIRFGNLMGPEEEKIIRKAVSPDAKFDSYGDIIE